MLLYVFQAFLLGLAMDSSLIWPYGWIAVALASSSTLFALFQSFLQTQQRASSFAINNMLNFLLTVFLTILLVVKMHLGALGVLLANLIANGVFFFYSLFRLYRIAKFTFDRPLSLSILAYSLPLVPHALSGWVTTTMDRIFLAKSLSIGTVGLYNVAYQLSFVLITISASVNQAYIPWFYTKAKEGSDFAMQKIALATESGLVLYSFAGFTLSYWIEEILSILVRPAYWPASQYVPILVFSAVWSGVYFFLCAPIFYEKSATKRMPFITFGSAIVNVVGNIYLIPILGAYGAAITSLAGNMVVTIAVVIYARMVMKIPYRYPFMFGWIAILGILPYSKYALPPSGHGLLAKAFAFSLFSIVYVSTHLEAMRTLIGLGLKTIPSPILLKLLPNHSKGLK